MFSLVFYVLRYVVKYLRKLRIKVNPAQVTLKMLLNPGYEGSNATPNLHRSFWDT